MRRKLLAALLGVLALVGLGVVTSGPAAAAGLACNPRDRFAATGSGTSTVHIFYFYSCNVDPKSAGATLIKEWMEIGKIAGAPMPGVVFADRRTAQSAATELTLCSHSGCTFSNFPPGRYQAFELLDIFGNVANADAHCGRSMTDEHPISCQFDGPVFNLT